MSAGQKKSMQDGLLAADITKGQLGPEIQGINQEIEGMYRLLEIREAGL